MAPITIKTDGVEYEEVPKQAVIGSKIAVDMYIKLGRPKTVFSKQGTKMMEILIAIWEDAYPRIAMEWHKDREEYKKNELSTKEQVSQKTGRSLASYPMHLYKMMKLFFTDDKFSDRKTVIKLVKKFPMFRMANKV